jgi:Arc/MetJ family transcription regulator
VAVEWNHRALGAYILETRQIYPRSPMTKRLVDIDDEILEEARRALGTTTLKDTVNESLRSAVQSYRRRNLTPEDITTFVDATEDLRNPEIMAKAWE